MAIAPTNHGPAGCRIWLPSTIGGDLMPDEHLTLASGAGLWARDREGRNYIDGNSGLWHLSLGYGHPDIAEAVARAATTLGGSSLFRRSHIWANDLAERLADAVPLAGGTRVFFATSGSEASDAAMRMALALAPNRNRVAYVNGAYHGVSLGPLSMMGLSGYRNGSPMAVPVVELPSFAAWERDPDSAATVLSQALDRYGDSVAALFVEPIQGSGGVVRIPADYAMCLRTLADRHGIVVVVDAIACGMYRSGASIAGDDASCLRPDIVLLGKGLSGGVAPLSAVLVRRGISDQLHGSRETDRFPGTTHSGGPIACAAALATLDVLDRPECRDHRDLVTKLIGEQMRGLATCPGVAAVRGWGHMWGVELEPAIAPREGEGTWVRRLTRVALDKGLLVHPLSIGVVPVFPALIAAETDIHEIVSRLRSSLTALT